MINSQQDLYHIKCTVESTSGSVFNINSVLNGDLDFGVAQSDRQYQAYHGSAEWSEQGSQKDLRAVFSIHPESVTLMASVESGIQKAPDLRNKRVNIGNPGSGQLQNSKDVLSAFGLKEDDVIAEYVKAVEAPGLLQNERIDAFFYTVGHPNGNIKEAASGRVPVRIIPLAGKEIDALIDRHSYYAPTYIPIRFYPNAANKEDVPSFGVKATLITSANVDQDVVYAITKEVFERFDEFKQLHPAYEVLTKEDMLKGLSAPIHKGALRYYRESGLIRHIPPRLMEENQPGS
jgi:TRAP transporter TAXI family solute receptor